MAWTTPRTWTAGEVVTAAIMNTHLKDNLAVLKTGRDATGRITDISSSTFANLSGLNLTGVAFLASGNAFTGGRHRYVEAARVRVPVGVDKWEDLGGGLRRGVWVEGDYFHHIASNQTTEYRYLGELMGSPAGALAGSVWIEGTYLHYIDSSGEERRCLSAGNVGAHQDVNALAGSVWIETFVHWIQDVGGTDLLVGQVERPGHADVVHSDGTVHNDTHGDTHGDTHSDTGHADSHGDEHDDVAHQDAGGHNDGHGDVGDPGPGHTDTHADHTDHADAPHDDTHNDSHTDTAHADSHTDTHSDDAHVDHSDHGDAAHLDQPVVV